MLPLKQQTSFHMNGSLQNLVKSTFGMFVHRSPTTKEPFHLSILVKLDVGPRQAEAIFSFSSIAEENTGRLSHVRGSQGAKPHQFAVNKDSQNPT